MVTITFSSCKKDESTILAQSIIGSWKMTEYSVDINLSFPAKIEQKYSNINVNSVFKSDKTFSNSGYADITSKLLVEGQVVEDNSFNFNIEEIEIEDKGTYNVISDTKIKIAFFKDKEVEFDVISFSDNKIELISKNITKEEDNNILWGDYHDPSEAITTIRKITLTK